MSLYQKEFKYLNDRREQLSASLTNAHFPSTTITQLGTDDPQWIIKDSLGNIVGNSEWLTYLGTDEIIG